MDEKPEEVLNWSVPRFMFIAFGMAVLVPSKRFTSRALPKTEASSNLAAIRACEEAYFIENGVYVEHKPTKWRQ